MLSFFFRNRNKMEKTNLRRVAGMVAMVASINLVAKDSYTSFVEDANTKQDVMFPCFASGLKAGLVGTGFSAFQGFRPQQRDEVAGPAAGVAKAKANLIITIGPTGTGKTEALESVLKSLDSSVPYSHALIDDFVETDPWYIAEAQKILKNNAKHVKDLKEANKASDITKEAKPIFQQFDKAYWSTRGATGCQQKEAPKALVSKPGYGKEFAEVWNLFYRNNEGKRRKLAEEQEKEKELKDVKEELLRDPNLASALLNEESQNSANQTSMSLRWNEHHNQPDSSILNEAVKGNLEQQLEKTQNTISWLKSKLSCDAVNDARMEHLLKNKKSIALESTKFPAWMFTFFKEELKGYQIKAVWTSIQEINTHNFDTEELQRRNFSRFQSTLTKFQKDIKGGSPQTAARLTNFSNHDFSIPAKKVWINTLKSNVQRLKKDIENNFDTKKELKEWMVHLQPNAVISGDSKEKTSYEIMHWCYNNNKEMGQANAENCSAPQWAFPWRNNQVYEHPPVKGEGGPIERREYQLSYSDRLAFTRDGFAASMVKGSSKGKISEREKFGGKICLANKTSESNRIEKPENSFRIVSYNVHTWHSVCVGHLNVDDPKPNNHHPGHAVDALKTVAPESDLLLLQEYTLLTPEEHPENPANWPASIQEMVYDDRKQKEVPRTVGEKAVNVSNERADRTIAKELGLSHSCKQNDFQYKEMSERQKMFMGKAIFFGEEVNVEGRSNGKNCESGVLGSKEIYADRGFLKTTIRFEGEPITVYNVHLVVLSRRGKVEELAFQNELTAEIEKLKEDIDSLPTKNVIIMGDWNSSWEERSGALKDKSASTTEAMNKAGLEDLFTRMEQEGAEDRFEEQGLGKKAFTGWNRKQDVDQMWVSNELLQKFDVKFHILKADASDHFPILADLVPKT